MQSSDSLLAFWSDILLVHCSEILWLKHRHKVHRCLLTRAASNLFQFRGRFITSLLKHLTQYLPLILIHEIKFLRNTIIKLQISGRFEALGHKLLVPTDSVILIISQLEYPIQHYESIVQIYYWHICQKNCDQRTDVW